MNQQATGKLENNFEVDLYLPYVDGDDADYVEKMDSLAKQFTGNDQRVLGLQRVNNFGQLKLALRSIYFCIPWIRHIHLIFHNENQVPEWLNINHPKLKVQFHQQYFDPQIPLPTFSSFVIDTQIDRVPGLAEHFIYMEDDEFFCKSVAKSDFFTDDGKPVLRYYEKKQGMRNWSSAESFSKSSSKVWPDILKIANWIWKSHLNIQNGIEYCFFDDHFPLPLLKSFIRSTHEKFPDLYQTSVTTLHRQGNVLSSYSYLWGMCWCGLVKRAAPWHLWRGNIPGPKPKIIDTSRASYWTKLPKSYSFVQLFVGRTLWLLRVFVPKLFACAINLSFHQSANLNDESRFSQNKNDLQKKSDVCEMISILTDEVFPKKSEFEI